MEREGGGKRDRSLPGEGRRVVPMIGCIPGESKGSKKGLTERRLLILAVSSPLLSIKTHPRDYHKYGRRRFVFSSISLRAIFLSLSV